MAGDHLKRALGIIEVLSRAPGGLPLQAIADSLEMPKSGAHRLLKKLSDLGWVRKDEEEGRHYLTLHLASLALRHLSDAGLADVAQPILDRLANESGEMVRLGAIDADRLFWVAKAQGARSGLRYDPDMGSRVKLACTATGIAWLAALPDAEAERLVAGTGFEKDSDVGPNAPRSMAALRAYLDRTRREGYALTVETAHAGTSALAAVVRQPGRGQILGTISIAGPSIRLTEKRMIALAPSMLEAAEELSGASLSFGWLSPVSPMRTVARRRTR
jgi:DNA-binding IclR family transcriptional regulator